MGKEIAPPALINHGNEIFSTTPTITPSDLYNNLWKDIEPKFPHEMNRFNQIVDVLSFYKGKEAIYSFLCIKNLLNYLRKERIF